MQRLVIANWKANLPPAREAALAAELADRLGRRGTPAGTRLLLAPSHLGLAGVAAALGERRVPGLGTAAQDCAADAPGAFTGATPAAHLAGLAEAVLIGHSERRAAGDTDALVGRKLAAAVRAGLAPILCLGDSDPAAGDAVRASGIVRGLVVALEAAVAAGVTTDTLDVSGLAIAYEPLWAIGTGTAAAPGTARAVAAALRDATGIDLRVLYGGSVRPADAADWFTVTGDGRLDGLLVGGASLEADPLLAILRAAG
jgi:triosephosphate isomerase